MRDLTSFLKEDADGKMYCIYEAVMNLDSRMSGLERKVDTMTSVCDDVDILKHQVGIMWAASKTIALLVLTSIIVAILYQIGIRQ